MIATIGVMIGVYIILRCLEIMGTADSHWQSTGTRIGVALFAGVTLLVAAFCTFDLMVSGTRDPTAVRRSSYEPPRVERPVDVEPSEAEKAQARREVDELIRQGHQLR